MRRRPVRQGQPISERMERELKEYEMTLKMKRGAAILLAALMIFWLLPFMEGTARAAENENRKIIPENVVYREGADSEELFRDYVGQMFFPEEDAELQGRSGEMYLTGVDRAVYDCAVDSVLAIAAGRKTDTIIEIPGSVLLQGKDGYTAAELGVSTLVNGNRISESAQRAFLPDLDKVTTCLFNDYSSSFYWNYGYGWMTSGLRVRNGKITIDEYYLVFLVGPGYQDLYAEDPEMTMDPSRVRKAQQAKNNALRIVEKYKDKTDYEKVDGYRQEICGLTDYDYNAMEIGVEEATINPWRVVNVFDGDPDTFAVCEGYARAFQYLVSQSSFRSPLVNSILAMGVMNGGDHMWNILTMDDGKNYLVDVTNCDGYKDERTLFLKGARGSVSRGYMADGILYRYEDGMEALYGRDTLTLSPTDYAVRPDDNPYPLPNTSPAPGVYPDVTASHWAYQTVMTATEKGLFNGYPDGRFYPDREVTRAEFITILWRMAGSPSSDYYAGFTDVNGTDYYADAVRWGAEKGYILGVENGDGTNSYLPQNNVSREQAMTILFRYDGGNPGEAKAHAAEYDRAFGDSGRISGYAKDAICWALFHGYVNGFNDGTLGPQRGATRAQIASILVRYMG